MSTTVRAVSWKNASRLPPNDQGNELKKLIAAPNETGDSAAMAFPSSFTDELLSRVSLASIAGRRLSWDPRKSRPARGDYWACCPFHEEKTASFHLDDQKGFYHCFGCKESGNAITFVRKLDNLGYREAIEFLAHSVGMSVPAMDPREAEAEAARKTLYDVCEEAARFFRVALASQAGSAARQYLSARGVADDAQGSFEIGFAPDRRNALTQHLQSKGVALELIQTAGLSGVSESGSHFDRFRNRIIFPIRDLRGRMIAFGGRAMDAAARAKYLNSPETPIFKKGSCLYNHRGARSALADSGTIVVTEGYMDVIALHTAGIKSCVAPLGTAITEAQLRHLWRLTPEPVLALDGDRAGTQAAQRTLTLAMPLLEPGKSLRFCFLPEDTDPDDFVRRFGGQQMRDRIDSAVPLAKVLWQTEREKHSLATPEGFAAFEAALRGAAHTIENISVRNQYKNFIYDSLRDLRRAPGTYRKGGVRAVRGGSPSLELRASQLAAGKREDDIHGFIRESVILGICLAVPEAVARYPDRLELLEFAHSANRRVLDSIVANMAHAADDPEIFRAKISQDCESATVERLTASRHLTILRGDTAEKPGSANADIVRRAEMMLIEEIEKVEAAQAEQREFEEVVIDARQGMIGHPIERLGNVVRERQRAQRGMDPLQARDYLIAENGVAVDRQEIEEFEKLVSRLQKNP